MYDLLYSSTTAQVEPALRDDKWAIFFRKEVALSKGRAEGEWVQRGVVVRIRKIKIIYRVQPGGIRVGAEVISRVIVMRRKDQASEQNDGKKEGDDEPDAIWQAKGALIQA